MILKNKKGSHLAIVLSLLLFVGFLVFLYVMIQPILQTSGNKPALIDSLQINLVKQLSANLTTVSISLLTTPGSCISMPHENGLGSLNYIVRHYETEIPISSNQDPTTLLFSWVNPQDFFQISYSEAVFDYPSASLTGCSGFVENTDYTVKSIKKTEKVFESKIIDFISIVNEDYPDAKTILKFPSSSDFGFNFTYSNGTTIGTSEREIATSIFAEEMGVPYIDKEGNHEEGVLTIKVW